MTRTTGADSTSASVAAVDAGPGVAVAGTGFCVRRIVFRVAAWATSLMVVVLFVFGLMEVVFMWLPDATVVSMFDDIAAADLVHRGHFNSVGIVAWALVLAVLVQLRKPHKRVAAMLLAVAVVLAGTVAYGLSGSLADWLLEEITLLVPVVLLASLHPRAGDLVRRPRLDRNMVGLVAVGALPWSVFAFTQMQLQWRNVAGDPHAEMEHWATSALMAIVIMLASLIGSTNHTGWRLPAWVGALASIDYGLHSLVFPEAASAASTMWAVATIVWGCVYAATIVQRSRHAPVM